jgi:hypothetical protein
MHINQTKKYLKKFWNNFLFKSFLLNLNLNFKGKENWTKSFKAF